jgi:hypothetical protein
MNRRSFCENLEIQTLFGCNGRNWLPDRAPRIVWPRSLAVFTMTIIVKIGRYHRSSHRRARPDFVQIISFPDRPQQPSGARSSVTECGRYRKGEHEPARELSADRRPIDNRHPLIVGARWRVLAARPGGRCRRPSRRQAMGGRAGCAPQRLRRPVGALPESGFPSHQAIAAGDGDLPLTVRSVIPASGLFAPCCFPALPCNPASFSLLFALGRSSSNSLRRNDFQL